MSKVLTPEDRRRIAEKVGVHPASLYQAMTGKGCGFTPQRCVEIWRDSDGELMRWDLRPRDWHLIWPELIDAVGAPAIQQPAQA